MTSKQQQFPELAKTMQIIKIGFRIVVDVGVIALLVAIIRSCQMTRIWSVATITMREAGTLATKAFFAFYDVIKSAIDCKRNL